MCTQPKILHFSKKNSVLMELFHNVSALLNQYLACYLVTCLLIKACTSIVTMVPHNKKNTRALLGRRGTSEVDIRLV